MIRLVSNIKWHNAKEESPKKDGIYLAITRESMVVKSSVYVPCSCLTLPYSTKLDKWNVTYDPFGETDMSTEIENVKWWASIDDIEEVFIEEGKE